jgi:hypothetical protein
MPTFLDPAVWLGAIQGLSRGGAAIVLVTSVSMLGLGLRAFRYYVCLAAAAIGFYGGTLLAGLMHVRDTYVGLPAGLVTALLVWFVARRLLPLAFATLAACAGGILLGRGFAIEGTYWFGFAAGGLFALGLWLIAPRFSTALLYAVVGSFGLVASIGAVVRASAGPLAVGAVSRYPLGFTVAGVALFLGAMVLQVVLDDYDTDPDLGEVPL